MVSINQAMRCFFDGIGASSARRVKLSGEGIKRRNGQRNLLDLSACDSIRCENFFSKVPPPRVERSGRISRKCAISPVLAKCATPYFRSSPSAFCEALPCTLRSASPYSCDTGRPMSVAELASVISTITKSPMR